MRRRALCRGIAVGGLAALGGCSALADPSRPTATPTGTPTPTTTGTPPVPADVGAAFDLVDLSTYERVELNVPWQFSFTVRNATPDPLTFETTLSTRSSGGEWRTFDRPIRFPVDAGATRTWESPAKPFSYVDTIRYRLDAFGRTWTVEVAPKSLDFGLRYTTPRDLSLTADLPSFRSGDPSGDGDGRWATVPFTVHNRSDADRRAPPAEEFELRFDGERRTPGALDWARAYRATSLAPGEETSGLLPYPVPAGLGARGTTLHWARSYDAGDVAVAWG